MLFIAFPGSERIGTRLVVLCAPRCVEKRGGSAKLCSLADSNEIEGSVPDTVRQKTSVFICVMRLKEVLIELFRHPVPELESLV
jgi:hypothetical protein